jgi:hypothetical protein
MFSVVACVPLMSQMAPCNRTSKSGAIVDCSGVMVTSFRRAVSLVLLLGLTACGGGGGGGDAISSTPLPQWRLDMAENTRINLGLNTQASVDPELNPALNPNSPGNAPWRGNTAYAGAFAYGTLQYASELGQYGSIVGTIGGHNGYLGNEVVRFDIESRQFAHLSDPYSSNSHPGSFHVKPNEGVSDAINGELFINASFNTDQTQPASFHPYSSNVVLPPDPATGVGVKGALITPVRAARYLNGVDAANNSHRTHIFDLAQSNRATAAWARYSTNQFEEGTDRFSYGWAVYDPTRAKVFAGIRGSFYNKLNVLNLITKQWESQITLSQNVYMFHSMAWHWNANPDYIINFIANAPGAAFELINVATGVVYTPGTTGTGPQLVGGYEWVQSSQKMAAYEGGVTSEGGAGVGFPNRVWILTPPSTTNDVTFRTTPWTWTFEDVTGPTPPAQTANTIPHIGRFVWADRVKCFIWWANGVDNVQAWRVKGFN